MADDDVDEESEDSEEEEKVELVELRPRTNLGKQNPYSEEEGSLRSVSSWLISSTTWRHRPIRNHSE